MAVSDVPAVKLGDNVEIQAAHALVLEYCRQVVDMVASVNATCKGRGLLFKYWSTPDGSRSRADRLPDSSAATALPLVYSDFTWRTGIGKGDNAEGSTWVVMEHCADASIHDAQTAAPGEKGSFLAVFVARPAPAFRKEAFEKSWRKCMAEHFDCGGADPDHLFSPRVHRGAFGELHAWRIDAAQLSSGAEFDRLILQPLREAIDGVMKRQG